MVAPRVKSRLYERPLSLEIGRFLYCQFTVFTLATLLIEEIGAKTER
jgi:hypothetical protein